MKQKHYDVESGANIIIYSDTEGILTVFNCMGHADLTFDLRFRRLFFRMARFSAGDSAKASMTRLTMRL